MGAFYSDYLALKGKRPPIIRYAKVEAEEVLLDIFFRDQVNRLNPTSKEEHPI